MTEEDQPQRGPASGLDIEPLIRSDLWHRSLPVTVWDALKDADHKSVEYFARRYATPIYCYFRRHHVRRDDAKDLTQGFILDKLVAGNLLKGFRPGHHRFRSYLVFAVRNYLIDWIRTQSGCCELGVVLEENPDLIAAKDVDAEAQCICDCVHDQLKAVLLLVYGECQRDHLGEHFKMFCLRHFLIPRPSWEDIGHRFDIDWQQAKNKAWTVRERLGKAILEEFRMQGMTDDQVMDELRQLMELFRNYRGAELIPQEWIQ